MSTSCSSLVGNAGSRLRLVLLHRAPPPGRSGPRSPFATATTGQMTSANGRGPNIYAPRTTQRPRRYMSAFPREATGTAAGGGGGGGVDPVTGAEAGGGSSALTAALMTLAAGGFVGSELMMSSDDTTRNPRSSSTRATRRDTGTATWCEAGRVPEGGDAALLPVDEDISMPNNVKDGLSPSSSSSPGLVATSAVVSPSPAPMEREYGHQRPTAATMDAKPEELGVGSKHRSYEVSARALKGRRRNMEDEYVVSDDGRFVAVFDGHGGSGVSRYLRSELYDRVRFFLGDEEGREAIERESRIFQLIPFLHSRRHRSTSPSVADRVAALRSAFRSVDREIMLDGRLDRQGSTAVAVILHEGGGDDGEGRTLLSANIGDSRAVLSRGGRAVGITRDHKPNDERERSRIAAQGEEVEWDGHVHRVRNLSLSRAIGDYGAKPAVSGEVEIRRYRVSDEDEFVVLASDGLWDVISNQEAVDFVHKKLERTQLDEERNITDSAKRKHMSRLLAKEALARGSGDNICVLIVWLNSPGDSEAGPSGDA